MLLVLYFLNGLKVKIVKKILINEDMFWMKLNPWL